MEDVRSLTVWHKRQLLDRIIAAEHELEHLYEDVVDDCSEEDRVTRLDAIYARLSKVGLACASTWGGEEYVTGGGVMGGIGRREIARAACRQAAVLTAVDEMYKLCACVPVLLAESSMQGEEWDKRVGEMMERFQARVDALEHALRGSGRGARTSVDGLA